jgi:hypothetical protein
MLFSFAMMVYFGTLDITNRTAGNIKGEMTGWDLAYFVGIYHLSTNEFIIFEETSHQCFIWPGIVIDIVECVLKSAPKMLIRLVTSILEAKRTKKDNASAFS